MYGKLPSTLLILTSKLKDKKYFDSGDYAMQKQLGGDKVTGVSMRHPNAEKVKEMANRSSVSSGVLYNGKSNLETESTPHEAARVAK